MGLHDALVEPIDLGLRRMELHDDCVTGKTCVTQQLLVTTLHYDRDQLMQLFAPLCGHQPEFGQVRTKCVD